MSTALNAPIGNIDNVLQVWNIPVTLREAGRLSELAEYLTASPDLAPEAFCREAKRAAIHLPNRLAEALRDFGRSSSVSGVIVFSGLPLGTVPDTPADNSTHIGERTKLARIQGIFNEFLGHMIGYEAECSGRLFQDMVPSLAAASTQTSLSSAVELELHTEQAFSQLRPDYLSLACLRGDPDACTHLLTARELVRHLTPAEVTLLRQPRWTTGVDESFRTSDRQFIHGDIRGPMPILSGGDDDPYIVLDQDLMRGIDLEAQTLLDRIIAIYPNVRQSHVLEPGQILLLDNARVVHGRSPFTPRFDGRDRFVVRSFVTCDLIKSRHARPNDSRVIGGQFS